MNCIYVYELDIKDLKPLVQIRSDDIQKYFCKELGYELSYPVGFILQFDPGSYYGGYALFSNPTNYTFIRVKYYGNDSGHDDRVFEGIKFKTNEGVNGAYSIDNVDYRGLQINGVLENKFIFEANGDIDETMEIFLDMMKSLRVLK